MEGGCVQERLQRIVMLHHRLGHAFWTVVACDLHAPPLGEPVGLVVGHHEGVRQIVMMHPGHQVDRAREEASQLDADGPVGQCVGPRCKQMTCGQMVEDQASDVPDGRMTSGPPHAHVEREFVEAIDARKGGERIAPEERT